MHDKQELKKSITEIPFVLKNVRKLSGPPKQLSYKFDKFYAGKLIKYGN